MWSHQKTDSFADMEHPLKLCPLILRLQLLGARKGEETSSVGREQVNKAYHAYREVCIDRDNLKNKLDQMVSWCVKNGVYIANEFSPSGGLKLEMRDIYIY